MLLPPVFDLGIKGLKHGSLSKAACDWNAECVPLITSVCSSDWGKCFNTFLASLEQYNDDLLSLNNAQSLLSYLDCKASKQITSSGPECSY